MPSVNTVCGQEQVNNNPMLVNSIRDLQYIASQEIRRFHRKAYRYLGNTHDAEDAVQDAFLCAYQHLSGFKGQAQLSSWFTRIVINSARMQLRRRRHYGIYN